MSEARNREVREVESRYIVLYKLSRGAWEYQVFNDQQRQLLSEAEAKAVGCSFEEAGFPTAIAELVDGGEKWELLETDINERDEAGGKGKIRIRR